MPLRLLVLLCQCLRRSLQPQRRWRRVLRRVLGRMARAKEGATTTGVLSVHGPTCGVANSKCVLCSGTFQQQLPPLPAQVHIAAPPQPGYPYGAYPYGAYGNPSGAAPADPTASYNQATLANAFNTMTL